MAETILRFIMAAIEIGLELLVQHTSKKVLSLLGPQADALPLSPRSLRHLEA
jgi:hypothetical protein